MNARQKRFCDEYLIDLNATQAAIRSGYSPKTAKSIGQENLTKPYIRAYIDEQLEQLRSEKIATIEEIMIYLTSVLRGQSSASVLSLCGDGCQAVIEKAPDEKERLKAAELLGKRYGMFTGNVNVEGTTKVIIVDDLDQ